jgi:hypothetical protein
MPAISRYAYGKAILLGEHAVVHAQPAVAIPLFSKHVKVSVEPQILAPTGKIRVISPVLDLDRIWTVCLKTTRFFSLCTYLSRIESPANPVANCIFFHFATQLRFGFKRCLGCGYQQSFIGISRSSAGS